MKDSASITSGVYTGLQTLTDASFPKTCTNCGQVFQNLDEFISATQSLERYDSGLKQSSDVESDPVLELLRNCSCGAMMIELFNNRRDMSEAGEQRRKEFDKSLARLIKAGIDKEKARAKLLSAIPN